MKTFLRVGSSFIAPVVVCLVLPYVILRGEQARPWPHASGSVPLVVAGGLVCAGGLALFIACVRMFSRIGRGTIMPWDPTRKLITGSLYGYVRNPMILSVCLIVAGEALLFGSWWLAALTAFFFVMNTVYFIFSEEPGLEKRFGAEYVEYKQNVPRWLPRQHPWRPGEKG